ncbi:MAG: hypothetical protein FWD48_07295 [Oscillospiraceae bacterium]|nr:hypothetical protein [Oscillospiraceae bacterium]
MTDYLIELFNVAVPFIACIPLFLYPMWKTRDVKTRSVIVYLCGYTLFLCGVVLFIGQHREINVQTVQFIMLGVTLPVNIMPFFVFRKRILQNIFLQTVALMYSPIVIGTGTHTAEKLFDSSLFAAAIISLVVCGITLPPLMFLLRKLYTNPAINQSDLWKFFWLIPLAFFAIIMFSGSNFISSHTHGIEFIIIRIVLYVVLLLICYLFEIAIRRIAETEAAKRQAEEKAAEADFYKKMSHQLLTPLTVVSTSIQTIKIKPEKTEELINKSQDKIMEMADMINAALSENAENEESGVRKQ